MAEDWRGSGLAVRLMASLMRRARRDGYETMEGWVIAENTAMLTLARKLGFEMAPADRGRHGVSRAARAVAGVESRCGARRRLLSAQVACHPVAFARLLQFGLLRAAQRMLAIGQRVWKWQPVGGRIGLGTSPCSGMRLRLTLGSGIGTADSRASV